MKIKEYYYGDAVSDSKVRVRHLMIKQLAEYRLESMTLREVLSALQEQVEKEYGNMPMNVLRHEYNKLFSNYIGE